MSTKSCLRLSKCFVRQCASLNPNSPKTSPAHFINSPTRITPLQSGAAHPARISSGHLISSTHFTRSGNTGTATPKRKYTNRTRSHKYFVPIFPPTTNSRPRPRPRPPNRHTPLHLSRWRCRMNTKTRKGMSSNHIVRTICHLKKGASLHGQKSAALPTGGFLSQIPTPQMPPPRPWYKKTTMDIS